MNGGYIPEVIRFDPGVPVRLRFERLDSSDCSSRVVIPAFGADQYLPAFETTSVDLHPAESGEYEFSCGMGMIHGRILVTAAAAADPATPVAGEAAAEHVGAGDPVNDEQRERNVEITDLIRRVIVAAVLTAPVLLTVMLTDFFGVTWLPELAMNPWLQLALIAPVMFYSGWPTRRTGWLALSHRTADMNSLITLGTLAAFGFSLVVTVAPGALPEGAQNVYYEAVGVIITLILLGRLMETKAKAGTGEAIRTLIGLQPRTARVIRDGVEREIPIEDVVLGDVVVARPGEKLPVDGAVRDGTSAVDESMVMMTGDNRATAAAIARLVGIGRVLAEVMPEHKAREVRRLQDEGRVVGHGRRRQQRRSRPGAGRRRLCHRHRHRRGHRVLRHHLDLRALSGVVTAIDLSRATMRNIRQNLVFAFTYNGLGIPLAAGLLYPLLGVTLSPMIAAAAMALSSLSVVANANRLCGFTAPQLPADVRVPPTDPVVEIGRDEEKEEAMHHETTTVTDPVCGMSIDPATAAASTQHAGQTFCFCSQHCAARFAADPHAYTVAPTTR